MAKSNHTHLENKKWKRIAFKGRLIDFAMIPFSVFFAVSLFSFFCGCGMVLGSPARLVTMILVVIVTKMPS
jgi:hypothetical protein